MPKRRGKNIAQAERLRGLLRIVAIDGDQWLNFNENTVAGLGFTAREQRQLIAAYKIRTTRPHYGGFPAVVTMENAEQIWDRWLAEHQAAMREMLNRDPNVPYTPPPLDPLIEAFIAAEREDSDVPNLDEH
jgi:hypothetical protein